LDKTKRKELFGEVFRFLVTGGIATIVDYLVFGLIIWLFDTGSYETFWQIFTVKASSSVVTIIATGLGFIAGLVVNYFMSIYFVYVHKGDSKKFNGILKFILLSVVGFLINTLGMYVGFTLLNFNEWIVKIVLTIVVMIYNYISKRLLIFNKEEKVESGE